MLDPDNPFWTFSLAVYAAPGVADECLALQSALNTDINALLFAAWIGAEQKLKLTERNAAAIDAHTRAWHRGVVQPLRAVRQSIKTMPEFEHASVQSLRKDIAAAELRAEQVEQALLYAAWEKLCSDADSADAAKTVPHNIALILQRNMKPRSDPATITPPHALISAALARSR